MLYSLSLNLYDQFVKSGLYFPHFQSFMDIKIESYICGSQPNNCKKECYLDIYLAQGLAKALGPSDVL